MLVSEGIESLRVEMERMRAMASSGRTTASLGLSVEFGGHGMPRKSPPVQLDLLPMRSSHSDTSTDPARSSVSNPLSWQRLASRINTGGRGASSVLSCSSPGAAWSSWLFLFLLRCADSFAAAVWNFWQPALICAGHDDGEILETYSSHHHVDVVGVSPRADIDMNQIPSETTDCDEAVVSSHTVSTICMKREREKLHVFDHLEQVDKGFDLSTRGGGSDDEDGTTRKKLRLSKEQSALLEESFKDHSTLNPVSCWPYSSDTSCCHVAQDCPVLLLKYHPSWSSGMCLLRCFTIVALAEAKDRVGKATKFASSASGSMVSKQKSEVCEAHSPFVSENCTNLRHFERMVGRFQLEDRWVLPAPSSWLSKMAPHFE